MANYTFPADLGTYQQGHFMKIKVYPTNPPSQTKIGESNNTQLSDTINLFVPGGGINGSLTWAMVHEYDDVKLTRLGAGTLGAVTRFIPGGDLLAAAGAAAVQTGLGAARVAGMGTINPKIDVLYGNSDLRNYQWTFFLAPQSSKENEEMHNIVKTLRKYSAPALTGPEGMNGASGQGSQLKSGLWFIPPAEFDISFYSIQNGRATPNKYLPKIGRGVITSITVDMIQQGEFSTFVDGAPTSVQLTIGFREMRIISQADIDNGY